MQLIPSWTLQMLLAIHAVPSLCFKHVLPHGINQKPTRVLGGVTIIDTPLVRAAQTYAQQHSAPYLYNHIMRSWLFGVLIISHDTKLQATVDLEVHALGAMLHDLGLVLNATWITPDRRFEVDAAFAATDFVETQVSDPDWNSHRLQLLFDAVLLSSEPKFSQYKEATVAAVVDGVLIDLGGPIDNVTTSEYNKVIEAFPKLNFLSGVNETLVQLCVQKPNTTWDSWQQVWGDTYVPGYSAVGHRIFDAF